MSLERKNNFKLGEFMQLIEPKRRDIMQLNEPRRMEMINKTKKMKREKIINNFNICSICKEKITGVYAEIKINGLIDIRIVCTCCFLSECIPINDINFTSTSKKRLTQSEIDIIKNQKTIFLIKMNVSDTSGNICGSQSYTINPNNIKIIAEKCFSLEEHHIYSFLIDPFQY